MAKRSARRAAASESTAPVEKAPAFTLPDQHGEVHTLAAYRGRWLVMFFYPEDDTPLCTKEACQFRDLAREFGELQASVVGVSPDDSASHARFAAKQRLGFPLLADVPGKDGVPKVSRAYGAFGEKNMYGKVVTAMLRTTVLITPDGTIARRWPRVKTPGHAEAVLAALSRHLTTTKEVLVRAEHIAYSHLTEFLHELRTPF